MLIESQLRTEDFVLSFLRTRALAATAATSCLFIGFNASAGAAESLYWTETGPGGFQTNGPAFVIRANADGSGATAIVSGANVIKGPNGLESFNGALYWPDQLKNSGRVAADGSQLLELGSGAYDIAANANAVFYSLGSANRILKSNADGSGLTTLITGLSFPFAIDVSPTHLYWSEFNSGKIRRSNLDGSDVQDLVSGIVAYDFEVTDDAIFYANTFQGEIWRANLDGSSRLRLIDTVDFINGIDVTADFLYWSDLGGEIKRANRDGSNEQLVYTAASGVSIRGVVALNEVAPVPLPATLPLLLGAIGSLAYWRRRAA